MTLPTNYTTHSAVPNAPAAAMNQTNTLVNTNTTNIATNTSGIATNTSAITALQGLIPTAPLLLSVATTKGDIFAATGSGAVSRVAAGTNGWGLTADSTQTAGVSYQPHSFFTGYYPFVPIAGEFLCPAHTTSANDSAISGNNMYMMPVDVTKTTTFDRIGTDISATGTGAGQVIRLGIYNDDGTMSRPSGAPLLDAGTITTTSGTGDKLITISQALTPGRYWLAWVLQGTVTTAPTVTTLSVVNSAGNGDLGNDATKSWIMPSVSGALPTLSGVVRGTKTPIVGLRST